MSIRLGALMKWIKNPLVNIPILLFSSWVVEPLTCISSLTISSQYFSFYWGAAQTSQPDICPPLSIVAKRDRTGILFQLISNVMDTQAITDANVPRPILPEDSISVFKLIFFSDLSQVRKMYIYKHKCVMSPKFVTMAVRI